MEELDPLLGDTEYAVGPAARESRTPPSWVQLTAALLVGALGGWVLAAHSQAAASPRSRVETTVVLTDIELQGVDPTTQTSTARLTGALVNSGSAHEDVSAMTWGGMDNRVDLSLDPGHHRRCSAQCR